MIIRGDQSKRYLEELSRSNNYNLIACGYEKLIVSSSVVGLANIPAEAKYALVSVESDLTTTAIRYLELGLTTPPTATEGIARSNDSAFDISGYPNLVNFRAIEVAAGTHYLHVAYYR